MSYDDDYLASARRAGQRLVAERARAVANAEEARAAGDQDTFDAWTLEIATLDERGKALNNAYNDRVAAFQPPEPPTLHELETRPLNRMSPEEVLRVTTQGSRFAHMITTADPDVQRGYREIAANPSSGGQR
jgi:hypothetical protein